MLHDAAWASHVSLQHRKLFSANLYFLIASQAYLSYTFMHKTNINITRKAHILSILPCVKENLHFSMIFRQFFPIFLYISGLFTNLLTAREIPDHMGSSPPMENHFGVIKWVDPSLVLKIAQESLQKEPQNLVPRACCLQVPPAARPSYIQLLKSNRNNCPILIKLGIYIAETL